MARDVPRRFCNYCGLVKEDVLPPFENIDLNATDGWWEVRGPLIPGQEPTVYDYCSRSHKDLDADPTSTRPTPAQEIPQNLHRPRPVHPNTP